MHRFSPMLRPARQPARALAVLIIALAMLAGLSACSQEESPYGGTLVLSTANEPNDLNPIYYLDTVSPNIGSLIFNNLIYLNEKLEFAPELAESWDVSEDGTIWDFYLKEGVKFHDGEELSAEDVVFTFESILDPAIESPLAPHYTIIDVVEAVETYRVRFRLKEPYSSFPYLLLLEIIPAHVLTNGTTTMEEFSRNPIGTGPFRFESWDEGRIVLTANETFYAGRPFLDKVIVNAYPDRGRAWAALLRGEVDVAMDLEEEDFNILEPDPRFETYSYLDVFYHTLLFNLRDPLLGEAKLREAIDLAVDREEIIDNTLNGWAVEITGPFRPGTWPYNPEVPRAEYDPGRAARILAELGWRDDNGDGILEKEGRELGFTILADRGDLLKEALARQIKWQLFQIGIRVEIEFLEATELFETRLFPGDFQAVLLQFNTGVDPDKFMSFFWHSNRIGSSNLGAYSNPVVDGLIDRGRTSLDFSERKRIYHEIHEAMARDKPAVFLFVRKIYFATAAKFQGVNPAPELFYQSIKDWRINKSIEERR